MRSRSDVMRALANGVGIVVSILLAFAIDASWDARSERLEEDALTQGIRGEFEVNLIRIDSLLAQHRRADAALRGFFEAPSPATEADADAEVDRLIYGLLVGDLLDPSTGSLEMLLSSGRLGLLSDTDLRALLWTWKSQVEDLDEETALLQSNVRENRQLLGRLGARGINRELRPSSREQFARLRASQELSTQAQTQLVDRRTYQRELTALRSTTERVLAHID